MEDDFKNNKINKPNIKISVIQSELFDESKNNLPYTLFIQLDNLPEKKIKTINNRRQIFEPPINEYIFELDIKENEIKEGNIKHILNFNAYITSLFFIQKKSVNSQNNPPNLPFCKLQLTYWGLSPPPVLVCSFDTFPKCIAPFGAEIR